MKTMRTIASILSVIVVTAFAVLGALILWLGPLRGIVTGLAMAALIVGSYVLVIGPWARRWGATDAEVHATLLGDEVLRDDAPSTTRAISIAARPDDVFPWLLQIGLGRGGWYSYDRIDNDGRPSLERLDPTLWLEVGDRIEMMPGMGPIVRRIDPGRAIVSVGEADAWTLFLEPTEGGTRLISRWRLDRPKTVASLLWMSIADPGAFVMERKMLLRLRELAERAVRETAGQGSGALR
jgi:hypothetical protein